MKRVTGIYGVFFKTKDTKKLNEWYIQHPGFKQSEGGGILANRSIKFLAQDDLTLSTL